MTVIDYPRAVEVLANRNATVGSAIEDIDWMLQTTTYRETYSSDEMLDFLLDLRRKLNA